MLPHHHLHAPVHPQSVHSQQKPEQAIFSQKLPVTLLGPAGVGLSTFDGAERKIMVLNVKNSHSPCNHQLTFNKGEMEAVVS